MKLDKNSTLSTVALHVGNTLRRRGIHAVLTGGACACVHTRGAYSSLDIDFILSGSIRQDALDAAMAEVGFRRKGSQYVHDRVPFTVEFPRGPLAIGADYEIRPVSSGGATMHMLMLSPTDSCRDRLADYYHWNDRQSLETGVLIALASRVGMSRIRAWSEGEGHAAKFGEFQAEVRRRKRRRARGR
ncbi:MAG: hypothetical protein HZB25_09600 [Candidatus Eisenbacteria bacterium]|nr:hypothetical protein [Candidatus Eisenbacteria bacterium]